MLIPTDDIKGALTVAAQHEIDGRLWIIAALSLVVGLLGLAMVGVRSIPGHRVEWLDLWQWMIRPRRATRRSALGRTGCGGGGRRHPDQRAADGAAVLRQCPGLV